MSNKHEDAVKDAVVASLDNDLAYLTDKLDSMVASLVHCKIAQVVTQEARKCAETKEGRSGTSEVKDDVYEVVLAEILRRAVSSEDIRVIVREFMRDTVESVVIHALEAGKARVQQIDRAQWNKEDLDA